MEPSYKDLLLQVLTVMGYRNKETYATEFEETNHIEAVTNCMEMLPVSLREKIKTKEIDAAEDIKNIPHDLYEKELTTVSTTALFSLLDYMRPVLTNDQKQEIVDIITAY